jgi:hypothetical protein
VFVTTPDDLRDTAPHPAPRRQFVIVLDGDFEIETTDGESRVFPAWRCGARRGHDWSRTRYARVEGRRSIHRGATRRLAVLQRHN